MIDMVDQLGVNHKVSRIVIRLRIDNPIDIGIVKSMVSKYNNVYGIEIYDHMDRVDTDIHY